MADDVTVSFGGDARDFLSEMARIHRMQQKIDRGFKDQGASAQKGASELRQMFSGAIKDATSFTFVLEKSLQLLKTIQANRTAFQGEVAGAQVRLDKAARATSVQLGGVDPSLLINQSYNLGQMYATSIESVLGETRALGSAGVTQQDMRGVLEEVLKFSKGTAAEGLSAADLAGFLKASGQELNQQNFGRLALSVSGLFSSDVLEASDLGAAAKAVGAGKEYGISQTELLSALTLAKPGAGNSADVAASFLKAFISKSAGDERIGLEGGLAGALERTAGLMEGKSDLEKTAFLKQTFGENYAANVLGLVSQRGRLDELNKMQTNTAAYNRAVATATTGAAADETRLQNYEDFSLVQDVNTAAADSSRLTRIINAQLKGKGLPNAAAAGVKAVENLLSLGLQNEGALRAVGKAIPGLDVDAALKEFTSLGNNAFERGADPVTMERIANSLEKIEQNTDVQRRSGQSSASFQR